MGKMKGWNFTRFYSADGSDQSTQDSLIDQKKKLEARLLAIPQLIAAQQRGITSMQSDYDWLSSLKKSQQKDYEKKNGSHPHAVAASLLKKIGAAKATIDSLSLEKKRIPTQLEGLQKQMDALIKGESEGLSKGLDKESAKALGEVELQKYQAELAHETKLQEIEQQKAERIAQEELKQRQADEQKGKNTKLIIGIGIVVILIIVGIVIYRRKMAKAQLKPLKA